MQRTIVIALTLMLSGRMMTLAFLHRAGGDGAGDPPIVWLMPLLGDAIVGLTGLVMAWLIARRIGLAVWSLFVVWNAIGIWDAMAAWIIHLTAPWPEFFMIQIFGASMFFAASAMHGVLIWLATRPAIKDHYLSGNHSDAEQG